jgi:predicted transcriptional regulator
MLQKRALSEPRKNTRKGNPDMKLFKRKLKLTDHQIRQVIYLLEAYTTPQSPLKKQQKVNYTPVKFWTKAEDEKLWNLWDDAEMTYKEIAKRLGRTEGAVSQRLKRLRKERNL